MDMDAEKDETLRDFGIRLKHARRAAKMSQTKLADVCGYEGGSAVICMIEAGKRNPPLTTIKKMAEVLNTTPSALAFGDTASQTSKIEQQILTMLWGLNIESQRKVLGYAKDLFDNEKNRVK